MSDYAAFAFHCAFHGEIGATLNQSQVVGVCRRRAGKIAALLHHHLFRADHFRKLFAEPFSGVYGVEFYVSECVTGNFFALGFHFGDNRLNARTFRDEDVYAVVLVHNLFEAFGFFGDVDFHFGNEHGVHVAASLCKTETVGVFAPVEHFAVFCSSRRRQPAAVTPHHFVDDEHSRICAAFADHVLEEFCALFGSRPCAEALADGVYVVVDCLGQTDNGQFVIIFL